MLKNYLKVAWRHLLQNRGLSFINIFGLATGMAFAILIGLWIQYETSFDAFHANYDRIAMVYKHTLFNDEKSTQEATPMPLYYEFKSNYPEVKHASRIDWGNDVVMSVGDKRIKKRGRYVDGDFLKMFSFPVFMGDVNKAFNDIYAVVITESTANALFGKENPVGKTVKVNNAFNVHVTAVVKDVPFNSTISFDFLGPYEYIEQTNDFVKGQRSNWSNNFLMNLVEVKEDAMIESLSKKIRTLNTDKDETLKDMYLFLLPMKEWHLKNEFKNWIQTGGKFEYVRLFGIIGIFVLLIACINFMNLSTARSEKRAREVGIRKSIGSLRSDLIIQFLAETMLTALIAFILAVMMIPVVLPLLKDLGFEHITFNLLNVKLLLSILAVALLTGLIAGSYPALYLSSFAPVQVLKGLFKQREGAVIFRKVLVVSQFAISIGLIISTVIVFQQIQHAKNRPLGYDTNNLIRVPANEELIKNFMPLKEDLVHNKYIESVARTSGPLTAFWNSWSDFSWDGKDPNAQQVLNVMMTEFDFEKTAGLTFTQGRPFSRAFKTDSNAVILNESALKMINYTNPIGRTMTSAGRPLKIVGIIKDVLVTNPFEPIRPMIIMFSPSNANNFVFVRLKEKAPVKGAIAAMQPLFEKYNPSNPFEYGFSDEDFEQKFGLEKQVAKLAGIFAMLAVFISCLGLFGLAAFMAERRTKEIGIRKVLGASLASLWALLSGEFVLLVMVGCLIASPVAYLLMNNWLQGYDYRITIHWWVFAIAGLTAIVIALITVSAQAIKAAIANPVRSLRSE